MKCLPPEAKKDEPCAATGIWLSPEISGEKAEEDERRRDEDSKIRSRSLKNLNIQAFTGFLAADWIGLDADDVMTFSGKDLRQMLPNLTLADDDVR